MVKKWKTKGLEGLLEIISRNINPWVASALDECEGSYQAKRVLLRALYKEYKEREKEVWHWKDWYKDVIVEGIQEKE